MRIETPIEKNRGTWIPSGILSQIHRPPTNLYYWGDILCVERPAIAVIGSRRPSHYGCQAGAAFAQSLAALGYAVVSGLARGIDTVAHQAVLRVGGKTIAVLGSGLSNIYPRENKQLSEEIVRGGGCLLSEYSEFMSPLRHHFPARNRIISGLCKGVVVIEAGEKSGSLITAKWALEQGREVFVVSGRYYDRTFRGGHELIQRGAKLVSDVSEIVGELPPVREASALDDLLPPGAPTSLSELFDLAARPFPELLQLLEQGKLRGQILEVGPQVFMRVSNA